MIEAKICRVILLTSGAQTDDPYDCHGNHEVRPANFALRAIIQKHYPTIAGHVIRLQDAHEDRAAAEWLVVAQDFAAAALRGLSDNSQNQ